MSMSEQMQTRLEAVFSPTRLEIINESHLHSGHSGDDGSGESHFRVVVRAAELTPMSRIARHRAVNAALGDLTTRIHALTLDIG